ncbi:hypothetical protein [Guggenheimella bovis]
MYEGKPDSNHPFRAFEVDGFTVYIKVGTRLQRDTLKIYLEKLLFAKWLNVEGLMLA